MKSHRWARFRVIVGGLALLLASWLLLMFLLMVWLMVFNALQDVKAGLAYL